MKHSESSPEFCDFYSQVGTEVKWIGRVPISQSPLAIKRAQETFKSLQPSHGNCEKVYVLSVDEEIYNEHRSTGAMPLKAHRLFESAGAASSHIGVSPNYVASALSSARTALETKYAGTTYSIRPDVTIRGVHLQYEKDVSWDRFDENDSSLIQKYGTEPDQQ